MPQGTTPACAWAITRTPAGSLNSSGSESPIHLHWSSVSEPRGDFHKQLEAIEGNVVALFALVAEDLAVATEALLNSDPGAVHVVAERHATVGNIYGELELLLNRQFVRQAPVATDLRLLLSVLRIFLIGASPQTGIRHRGARRSCPE